jgi:hypothetical protein
MSGKEFEIHALQHQQHQQPQDTDIAEAMTVAQATARDKLVERIRRWNERTLENVGDDIIKNTFPFTTAFTPAAAKLEKKAYALEDEYNALVAAHEKLFAHRYSVIIGGVTRYLYKYPTRQLWMERPSNNILIQLFTAAANAAGDVKKADEMKEKAVGYDFTNQFNEYRGLDTLPSTAVLCPDPLVSEEEDTKDTKRCAIQGGSKKSKSKYSRKSKSKSKYSRKSKSKSKYSRKSKSKSKYSRKY